MKIIHSNHAVEKQFSSNYKKTWRYPKQVIKKLIALENFIICSSSLQDIIYYPSFHFHKLMGNHKNQWSINLGHTGYRVILIPCDEKQKLVTDKDILSLCKSIKIVCIMEVTNHYE